MANKLVVSNQPPPLLMSNENDSLDANCSYGCGSMGIPILPVVYSKLNYKINSKDERYFEHDLTLDSKSHNALTSLPSNCYLYMYVDRRAPLNRKGVYFTGQDGALKRISLGGSQGEDQAQPPTCTKKNHNTLDSKFISLNHFESIWLMISHAKLSQDQIWKLEVDEDYRKKRMQKIDPEALAKNSNTEYLDKPENSKFLLNYMKSFHLRKHLSNSESSDPFNIKYQIDEKSIDRKTHSGSYAAANALYRRMQNSIDNHVESLELELKESHLLPVKTSSKVIAESQSVIASQKLIKPMMVALPDPVGEVLAAAEKRNYLLKKLDDKYKDKSKVREQVNAIIIDNIRQSLEASVEYDSTVPQAPGTMADHITGRNEISQKNNKNIYNYINQVKFQAVLEEAKKSRQDKAAIAAARQTFIEAITNPEFARVMREDFPKNDEDSHVGYAQIIAQAIQGIGIDESNIGIPDSIWADYQPEQAIGMSAKQEFEQSLLPCITGQKPIEDNWLIKALIGLNKEDNQKMADAPTFENLAPRASDFIGTATNWAMAFKAKKQKQNIKTSQAQNIERLNDLANYKAQVVQTLSSNMAHIKDNHKLLYKLDLWSQATVHQATGFKLAQRVLKYSPEAVLKWSEQRLSRSINKAKPHATLLPASIDNRVVSSASSVKTPIAIDLVNSHGVNQTALDIFDKSANGNEHARTVVTMYASEDIARTTQTINEDITRQVAQLNSDLDPINGQYSQLERQSAGKAALVSVGIGLFQLRSIWMGKSSLGSMARRGDRLGLEFMTAYASTTLALTTASLDVANAGLQMKAARSAWVARLSLSVGVLGAVGAGFEVYSLNISLERHMENKSGISERATNIAIGSAFT
ncbi:toxin VasX, partial [Psychrobacter sp.]